eukprot:Em0006g705a
MLKGLALIAALMVISANAAREAVMSAPLPITIAFQFNNNAKQGATIELISLKPESFWGEHLEEDVASNGGFTQGQITGVYTGTGGSFRVVYLSGEVFLVTASFGGGANSCIVDKYGSGTGRIAMKATSKVQGRLMTCTLNSFDP